MTTAKVILITGATSGIGFAAALAFTKRGTHVIATGRRAERLAALANTVNSFQSAHGEILTVIADVTDAHTMQAVVQHGLERFGRLDGVVANAGLGHRGGLIEAEWDDLQTVLRTNIDGVLHTIRAAVPAMRKSGGGQIVIISSVAGRVAMPYSATYGATKAFVSSLGRSLRMELADDNIGVTDMLVGRTDTEFNEKRLGAGKRSGGKLPTMTADKVADAIVRAVERRQKVVVLRPFDRLILLGNRLAPGLIGRLAKRQYRTP